MDIPSLSRVSLTHLPTPMQHLPRLSKALGGPDIYVKRDDCTGLGFGGNKARKLEFLMADALQQNATTIVTMGTLQSNHPPLTAAAACRLGLKCELILEHRVAIEDDAYHSSGNAFLCKFYGAATRVVSGGEDANAVMASIADEVRRRNETPYMIPRGGSNAVGALGYVQCAQEILAQAKEQSLDFDCIVHATASGGTQAGLLAGLRSMQCDMPVIGIGVNASEPVQARRVYDLAKKTAASISSSGTVSADDVKTICDYVGPGYGMVSKEMTAALLQVARLEGLLLDPVYSGKAMAGLIDLVKRAYFADARKILFIHTGGTPALFAYRDQLDVAACVYSE